MKKDIALNDDIKHGTKSFEENYSQMKSVGAGSKLSLAGMTKIDSTSVLLNKVASNLSPFKFPQDAIQPKSFSEEKKNQ